jgi:hypothetical protein
MGTPSFSVLSLADLPHFISRLRGGGNWWERAAAQAHDKGHFRVISGRESTVIYLLRFWLTPPVAGPDQGFESGNSVLLHYFAQGDDDPALHDHPWDFTTTIQAGGYWEHLPPHDWQGTAGPAWDKRIECRSAGMTVHRVAEQLHLVGEVLPGTVTLVRTGERRREWGFHAPGQMWCDWRTYLSNKKIAAAIAANAATVGV